MSDRQIHAVILAWGSGSRLLPYHILFEPVGRNTAPAIVLAAKSLMVDGADPIMVVLPADHIIKDEARFGEYLSVAIKVAENGKHITFGIQHTRHRRGARLSCQGQSLVGQLYRPGGRSGWFQAQAYRSR